MFKGMAFTTIDRTPIKPMSALVPLPDTVMTEMSKEDFVNALNDNPGALVIKFGAEWCGPCKRIDPMVYEWMSRLPPTIQGAVIDIDDNFDIYALLKSKRIVNGVPVILCYKKGNLTLVPDHIVVGADENQIRQFFDMCMKYA
jgi:thiol-disulfide isomerase/thioredoxin